MIAILQTYRKSRVRLIGDSARGSEDARLSVRRQGNRKLRTTEGDSSSETRARASVLCNMSFTFAYELYGVKNETGYIHSVRCIFRKEVSVLKAEYMAAWHAIQKFPG
ncbi:hypothetical protein GEV33_013321 [Tenebrio molitor]|uniref:Uncharacterized protein n=1 Tax=Tenebrio molitor TaxID=7067 RepID=A0A8J6H0F5_TENMO|nr:hypothetical protein GEV33_013321 [Tenebrio molitor]